MGAYLSTPLTEKESTDEVNEYLACGASQMQGWRMSQEVNFSKCIQYLWINVSKFRWKLFASNKINFIRSSSACRWKGGNIDVDKNVQLCLRTLRAILSTQISQTAVIVNVHTFTFAVHKWQTDAWKFSFCRRWKTWITVNGFLLPCRPCVEAENGRRKIFSETIVQKSRKKNNFLWFQVEFVRHWHAAFNFYSQDAHICSLDFDKSTSLFAVFDGHGGSEVALYCSKKLPEFLKSTDAYKKREFERALKDAFLGFDATLVDEEIIKELKHLMPADKLDGETSDEDGDDDEEDISELRQESRMPLEQLLEKLKEAKNIPLNKLKQGEGSGAKPLSPFLRGRRNGPSEDGSAQNGDANAIIKRQIDVDGAEEEEAVSSSSASVAIDKGQSVNEPSSSNVATGDASQIAGSTSDAQPDNGPSSSSGEASASSSSKLDFANSPDSSSTANKTGDDLTNPASEPSKVNATSESHVDGAEGGSSSPLKKVAAEQNGKGESVSSSSTAENGAVASSDAPVSSQTEKPQNKISSSAKLPSLNESDDSNDEDAAESKSENEEEAETDDEDEGENEEDDEDEEEDEEDEEGELYLFEFSSEYVFD